MISSDYFAPRFNRGCIDTLKSTLHRVRAPPLRDGEAENGKTEERFSIPYVRYHVFAGILPLLPHSPATC